MRCFQNSKTVIFTILAAALVLSTNQISGQSTFLVQGKLVNIENNEDIPLVHFQIPKQKVASVTDESGQFVLKVSKGNYLFQFSHLSYELLEQ